MIRLLALCCILFGLAMPAPGDTIRPPLPALYAVTGVASDDVLNIRAVPDPSARIVGTLAADRQDVEVIDTSLEGNWALIGEGEVGGWVSFRFLERQDEWIDNYGLPARLRCRGTEPFYTMRLTNDGVLWSDPEGEAIHPIARMQSFLPDYDIRRDGLIFTYTEGGAEHRAMIVPSICSDGMSDTLYGMRYIDERMPHYGCCTLR